MLIIAAALAGLTAAPAHAGTWCGTPAAVDRVPNVIAGNPIHVVYAFPSDGQDRTSQFASQMQTDAETVDAWWRGQDPIRTMRFDLQQFSCGPQLDISTIRLVQPGALLNSIDASFTGIGQSLNQSGIVSQFVRYLVYYDGPVIDPNVCGVGGTANPQDGPALAIVFVNSCTDVSTSWTSAHEVTHALGAVPIGAPHNCAPPNNGHTCDTAQDLMFPFVTSGAQLSQFVLDPGRDDYYGHSGSWWDVQDSKWLVDLDRQVQLGVAVTGSGAVASDVPGVYCTATCSSSWNSGTQVTLTPVATAGNRFVRWSGACTGAVPCTIALSQASAVTALFAPATFGLSVSVGGRGTIRVSPLGLVCASQCKTTASSFLPETLRATAAKGWRFKGWTGACRGKTLTCSVPMSAATSVRAQFVKVPVKKKKK